MAKDGLQKLNRAELLKLLLEVEEENEHLRKQVEDLQAQLDDRTIRIEKSGDLATAALQLNGVFEAADAACRHYAENIKERNASLKARCSEMEQQTRQKCEAMEQETAQRCKAKEEETVARCKKFLDELNEKCSQYRNARGSQTE